MVWPFRRARSREAPVGPREPLASADRAALTAAAAWWHAAGGYEAVLDDAAGVLRVSPRRGAAHGLVVAARRGKLVRVDVHDPALRPQVDAMVRHFESRGVWSFNGVVRTRTAGSADPPPPEP